MREETLELDYGSSVQIDGTWLDENGAAIDFTGSSIDLMTDTTTHLSAAWINPETGTFTLTMSAVNAMLLRKRVGYAVRIRATSVSKVMTSPQFQVMFT